MKPTPFNYLNATSIDEATELLSKNSNSKIIAGGQSLVPMMNFRLVQSSTLIDISNVNSLKYIKDEKDYIEIGSLVTHSEIIESNHLKKYFPIIPKAISYVAHLTIRNQGTIGGSIANADPASEWPLIVNLLNAKINVINKNSNRLIPAHEFFESHFVTDLNEDEIIVSIKIPKITKSYGWSFLEFSMRDGDFAIVAAGAIIEIDDNEIIRKASIALGGVDEKIITLTKIENYLIDKNVNSNLSGFAESDILNAINPVSDNHSSTNYKKHLSKILVKKVINDAKNKISINKR